MRSAIDKEREANDLQRLVSFSNLQNTAVCLPLRSIDNLQTTSATSKLVFGLLNITI